MGPCPSGRASVRRARGDSLTQARFPSPLDTRGAEHRGLSTENGGEGSKGLGRACPKAPRDEPGAREGRVSDRPEARAALRRPCTLAPAGCAGGAGSPAPGTRCRGARAGAPAGLASPGARPSPAPRGARGPRPRPKGPAPALRRSGGPPRPSSPRMDSAAAPAHAREALRPGPPV